ncbi:MAG TPA: basic amino acid ABC transporter substrate-binding protein [Sutterella sp.]|nr:basic amino acid ABC transporter substrate-binding protein [Sutterella sp.]
MQKRQLLIVAAELAALAALPAAALAGSDKVLSAGMDAAYPPFGSQDMKSGEYVGFDVDIIKAIGRVSGFDVQVRNLPFDGLIPALRTGTIDIAINDITISEERARTVDFSRRYYIAGLGVVVRAENRDIRTERDLEGKRLGVSIGSTGEIAAKKIAGAKVRVFNQLNEAFWELRNGGVDAVINDIPTNDYYVTTAGKGKVKSLALALTEEDLGIAVRKGNRELLGKINRGLERILADGTYAALYRKWFGKEPPKEIFRR